MSEVPSKIAAPPLPALSPDLMVWNAAFEAARYSFRNPNEHGGGMIGKASVICAVLGLDPEMTLGELHRRLAPSCTSAPSDGES